MKIGQLCDEYHYTVRDLAVWLGVHQQIIATWEHEVPPLKDFCD